MRERLRDLLSEQTGLSVLDVRCVGNEAVPFVQGNKRLFLTLYYELTAGGASETPARCS